MNKIESIALGVLCTAACWAAPGQASEVLNLAAAAGHATNPIGGPYYAECYRLNETSWIAGGPPSVYKCNLVFPIPLPSGRVIRQIAVLYGALPHEDYPFLTCDEQPNDNPNCWAPQQWIAAYVQETVIAGAGSGVGSQKFYWESSDDVPVGPVAKENLMNEGVTGHPKYPDSFTLQPNRLYQVQVSAAGDTGIVGLRIIYD